MKTFCISVLLALAGNLIAGETNPPVAVLLGQEAFKIGATQLKIKDLGQTQTVDGTAITPESNGWLIKAGTRQLRFQVEGFKDNSTTILPGSALFVAADWNRNILDFRTPRSNTNTVRFTFHDGATAVMGPSSTGRVDQMKDDSYYFWARGRAAGENADGAKLKLGPVFPPLFGGPLRSQVDTNGVAKMGRLLPTIPVLLSGFDGKEVTVRVGDELFEMKLGDRRTIKATNESQISFYFSPATKTVEWDITKGAYRFNAGGFECWKALGLADEAAAQQWDLGTQSIDLRNYSKPPEHSVLVMLAARVNVAVFPKATFQYGFMNDCLNFATSGAGGPILLYNDDTKQVVPLQTQNLLFRTGVPVSRNANDQTKTVLRLGWQNPANAEVKSVFGTLNVPANMERVLGSEGDDSSSALAAFAGLGPVEESFSASTGPLGGSGGINSPSGKLDLSGKAGTGLKSTTTLTADPLSLSASGGLGTALEGKVFVSHLKDDEITVTATQGNYIVRPDFLDNVTIELKEGESISFHTSQNGKSFSLKAASNSSGTPEISFGNAPFAPLLGTVTVIKSNSPGGTLGGIGGGGDLVFNEGAGGNNQGTTINPPGGSGTGFGSGSGNLNLPTEDRVTQSPVSPAR